MSRPTFLVEASLDSVWTDITDDVLDRAGLRVTRGIPGSGPTDRVAKPGRMTFAMNNGAGNSANLAGYYSPGHANLRSGWGHGTYVRLKITSGVGGSGAFGSFGPFGSGPFGGDPPTARYVFYGRLIIVEPTPGVYGSAQTNCTAADWMQDAQDFTDLQLVLSEGERSDELIASVVALMPNAPLATAYDTGSEAYSFAWDDIASRVSATTAIAKLTRSEGGWCYVKGDTVGGEQLTLENRTRRQSGSALITVTAADMRAPGGIEVPSAVNRVFNDVTYRVFPRRLDTANSVLVKFDAEIEVAAGATVTVWADYRDVAANEAEFVGGKTMVTPAINTDFTINDASGGGGTAITSTPGDFTLTVTYFGSVAKIVILNSTGSTFYFRGPGSEDGAQLRGLGLYRYSPIAVRVTDASSIATFGRRAIGPVDLNYQTTRANASTQAALAIQNYSGLGNVPTKVRLNTAVGSLLQEVLKRDIGDRVTVSEAQTAVDATDCFINNIEYELGGGVVWISWGLAPADPTGAFLLDDATFGVLDTGALGF